MDVSADISLPSGDAVVRDKARMRLYVLLQAVGWGTLLAVASFVDIELPEKDDKWAEATRLAVACIVILSGFLISHFMRPLMARWRWKELGWRRLLPRLVVLAVAASIVLNVGVSVWIHDVLGLPWNTSHSIAIVFALQLFQNGVLFFAWLCLYFFYHVFDRLNRSEIERFQLLTVVKEAELRALKSQVNPHFIFNSLNSLRALIDEDPARARTAVTQLANLLRYSLKSGQLETVSFEEELGVVNDYLALEQVRHEERLRLRLDIAPEALHLPIPPMLLQTLVENAVKYGISQRPEGGEITITAYNEGGALRILVSNPGELAVGTRASSTGLGLHNAAERLRLIFGERATLRLRSDQPALVVAEAVIPMPAHP
jgi:two-component system, LytTR family, sensor kinase